MVSYHKRIFPVNVCLNNVPTGTFSHPKQKVTTKQEPTSNFALVKGFSKNFAKNNLFAKTSIFYFARCLSNLMFIVDVMSVKETFLLEKYRGHDRLKIRTCNTIQNTFR
jgi:hypothetical protein